MGYRGNQFLETGAVYWLLHSMDYDSISIRSRTTSHQEKVLYAYAKKKKKWNKTRILWKESIVADYTLLIRERVLFYLKVNERGTDYNLQ